VVDKHKPPGSLCWCPERHKLWSESRCTEAVCGSDWRVRIAGRAQAWIKAMRHKHTVHKGSHHVLCARGGSDGRNG
jgi:hypothetical protein